MIFKRLQNQKKDRFVLVLGGGGLRGFYSLGVLKAIEESGLKPQIDAVYGVSVGAIIASYRASGWSAQQIFDRFKDLPITNLKRVQIPPIKSILTTKVLENYFKTDIKSDFEDFEIPVFIGASDLNSSNFIFFNKGKVLKPLLGSLAIPGVFPSVSYDNYLLNDGAVINNFPTNEAKKHYPKHKIIGVALSKFSNNTNPKNLVSTLITSYFVMINNYFLPQNTHTDILFYEEIDCRIIDLNRKKREKAFQQGYKSGKTILSKQI